MTACVLHLQYIGKAHQEYVKSTEPNTEPLNPWGWQTGTQFSRWAGNFKLWFIVLQRFVRSIRSGNFPPYTQSLAKLVHWFFTYEHYHYVRWVSVHLRDIMTMAHLHPTCKQDSWRDTSRSRRRVMCFQTWQHNAVLKDDCGAGCLIGVPLPWRGGCSADQRWHVSLLTLKDESIAHCTGVQNILM